MAVGTGVSKIAFLKKHGVKCENTSKAFGKSLILYFVGKKVKIMWKNS